MIRQAVGVALAVGLWVESAWAQQSATISGRVIAKGSSAAIVGAEVLLAPGSRRLASDDDGAFKFEQAAPGNVTLIVRHLGFAPESASFPVQATEDLDVVIELNRVAQALDTVSVSALENRIVRGKLANFYERKKFGIGRFIDSTILAQQENRQLGELIASRTPGSRRIRSRGSNAAWIATTRHSSLSGTALDPTDRLRGADPRACYPDVYFDGAIVYSYGKGMPLFDINGITANSVSAVEVYVGPSQTPMQYAKVGSVCGVVLIWTK